MKIVGRAVLMSSESHFRPCSISVGVGMRVGSVSVLDDDSVFAVSLLDVESILFGARFD